MYSVISALIAVGALVGYLNMQQPKEKLCFFVQDAIEELESLGGTPIQTLVKSIADSVALAQQFFQMIIQKYIRFSPALVQGFFFFQVFAKRYANNKLLEQMFEYNESMDFEIMAT